MQTISRTIEAHHDVVFLNGSAHRRIHHRPGLVGVYEIDRAAFENVAVPLKDEIAAGEVHAAKNHRIRRGTADLEIGRAIKAQRTAGQVNAICGCDS